MVKEYHKLSERQRNIIQFMLNYVETFGFPPSIREIGEATDIASTSVVNYNLNKLVEAGYLVRTNHVSRGLRLVEGVNIPGQRKRVQAQAQHLRLPLIGHIVASKPVQMPEDSGQHYDEDDLIDVPSAMLKGADPADTFALIVKGDSMIDAMIREGDIVIMRRQSTAQAGDMVAVWLTDNNETTLKYYYPEGERVRLQPAHPQMDAIYVKADTCQIRGKVLSVLRYVQ